MPEQTFEYLQEAVEQAKAMYLGAKGVCRSDVQNALLMNYSQAVRKANEICAW